MLLTLLALLGCQPAHDGTLKLELDSDLAGTDLKVSCRTCDAITPTGDGAWHISSRYHCPTITVRGAGIGTQQVDVPLDGTRRTWVIPRTRSVEVTLLGELKDMTKDLKCGHDVCHGGPWVWSCNCPQADTAVRSGSQFVGWVARDLTSAVIDRRAATVRGTWAGASDCKRAMLSNRDWGYFISAVCRKDRRFVIPAHPGRWVLTVWGEEEAGGQVLTLAAGDEIDTGGIVPITTPFIAHLEAPFPFEAERPDAFPGGPAELTNGTFVTFGVPPEVDAVRYAFSSGDPKEPFAGWATRGGSMRLCKDTRERPAAR